MRKRRRFWMPMACMVVALGWPMRGFSQAVVATVPVGTGPVALAVNSATNQIYVLNQTSNNVTVIDGATNNTTTVPVGPNPVDIAVNSTTNQIYVLNQTSDDVTVIDGTTNITTTVAVGMRPVHLVVNPVTNHIYVVNECGSTAACNSTGSVTVIDGATNNTTTVPAGVLPAAVALNSVTNQIYVPTLCGSDLNCLSVGNLIVIDGATNNTSTVAVGYGPGGVAVDPVLNVIFVQDGCSNVNCDFAGDLREIDGATLTVIADLGQAGRGDMAVNPAANRLYVDGLFVCDLPNFANVVQLSIPAYALAVNQVTNKIYGIEGQNAGIAVIDGATNNSVVVLTDGTDSQSLAVNPVTNLIYVVNQGTDNVTVINGAAPFTGVVTTTTTLISDNNPAQLLQTVTFTATVTSGTGATPTGTITFMENGNALGAALLNASGVATFATSSLELGSYNITASYGGDANFSASTSVSLLEVIALSNAVPALTSLSPSSAAAGSASFTLTVTGSNFESAPVVQWNGTPLATTFLSPTQLTAPVPASDIASAGTASITVVNPPPGGGTSATLTFSIVDFTVSSTTNSQTVTAGRSAMFTLTTSSAGVLLANPVTFSVTGLPKEAAATFAPSSVTVGTSTTMTVTTTARTAAAARRPFGPLGPGFPGAFAAWLALLALASLPAGVRVITTRPIALRRLAPAAALTVLLAVAGFLSACAGDSAAVGTVTGTPAGSYPITVTGTSGAETSSTIVTLVVQ